MLACLPDGVVSLLASWLLLPGAKIGNLTACFHTKYCSVQAIWQLTPVVLLLQLCHIVRLLDVRAALDTLPDKQRREAARQALIGGSSSALESALNHAANLVAKLRDSSAYRWVDLGAVFAKMRAGRKAVAAAGNRGAARPGVRA
jgi:hypothetical protein